MWFGAVSVEYPDLVGSLGEAFGRGAVGWGVAVSVALWITGFWVARAGVVDEG
jgi:hypothetical protein